MSTLTLPWVRPETPREESDGERWRARPEATLIKLCHNAVSLFRRYHDVHFEGAEHLPRGPALLVGNHGLLGYEAVFFFDELHARTGRIPVGLADRWFFKVPLMRELLVRVGGAYGDARNARRLLDGGDLVVCYPGGAREAFKQRDEDRYKLLWEKSHGFVRVALETGVPLVPFAAAGVDDTFDIVGQREGLGRWWMGHDKYDVPKLRGRAGLPVPRAVPFLFRLGAPMHFAKAHAPSEALVSERHAHVWETSQRLLDETVATWRERYGAPEGSGS